MRVGGTLKEPATVTISCDGKPGIQALAATTPDKSPSPNKYPGQLRDYEYIRPGTVSLLADMRDQISSVTAAINANQQFWLADAALAASMTGKPTSMMMNAPAASSGGAAAGH